MEIPKFTNPTVVYRNGEEGLLLTTQRKDTSFPVVTMRAECNNLIYHDSKGNYLGNQDNRPFDIVAVK